MLRQVLNQWNESLEIRSFVIFINPGFTLYEAKSSNPFILPTQINNYFEKIRNMPSQPSKVGMRVLNKLQAETQSGENYRGTPYTHTYSYSDLKKGPICSGCQSFDLGLTQRQAVCRDCGRKCSIDCLISEHIDELSRLFPEDKISLCDWLKGDITIRRIRTYFKEYHVNQQLGFK